MNNIIKIGCVAKCGKNKIGIINKIKYIHLCQTPQKKKCNHKIYYGIGLDGKRWKSKNPTFVANNINEFIESLNK